MKLVHIIILVGLLLVPVVAVVVTTAQENAVESKASPTSTPTSSPNTTTMTDPADAISAIEVILKTNKGDIRLNLTPDTRPNTVKNFVTLGKRGYYDGVTFHRVIQDFMIQGGDPTGTGAGGTSIYGETFPDELTGNKVLVGDIAMANRGANTNGSQFFIVTETDQPGLDPKHSTFGRVADDASLAVVRAIAAVQVDGNDKPVEPVTINSFVIVK